MSTQAQPSVRSTTPAARWARTTLLRSDATDRSPLLRALVGVTQLHVKSEYPDEEFLIAAQNLGDQLYNTLVADEASVHFAAAVLFQAGASEAQRQPHAIKAAASNAMLECVAALLNLAREEASRLPDCTEAGREILAKQLHPQQSAPTPPQEAAS